MYVHKDFKHCQRGAVCGERNGYSFAVPPTAVQPGALTVECRASKARLDQSPNGRHVRLRRDAKLQASNQLLDLIRADIGLYELKWRQATKCGLIGSEPGTG